MSMGVRRHRGPGNMKSKLIGFAAVALLLVLGTASIALADGIRDGSDHDFDQSSRTFDVPSPAIHADNPVTEDIGDRDAGDPQYDHILASSSGHWFRDHDKDRDDDGDLGSDPVPEPSTLVLLAAGLTPLLWVRRRGDGV